MTAGVGRRRVTDAVVPVATGPTGIGARDVATSRQGGKGKASSGATSGVFTPEERAAMREHAREMKAASRRGAQKADDEKAVLEKLAEMPDADRMLAEHVHAVVTATAPQLAPKTWYGMPAYARDGQVVCFFQGSGKFKARYSALGFNDPAKLDDGAMWPIAFAIVEWTPAVEKKVATLVKAAAG
jgi:uncharacterized protein YdhG (YjbR/CyaY superfamily)